MLKRSFVLAAFAIKAMALMLGIAVAPTSAVADEDCVPCAPDPWCYPDDPCWDES